MAKRKVKRFNGEDDSLALADENYGDNTTREERLAMLQGTGGIRSRNEGVPAPVRNLSDDMYSDYGPAAGRVSSETTSAPAPAPRAAAKAPIVTKEELAASGLSLRDYLNKQRGLTRRGEPSGANYSNEGRSRPAPEATTVEKTVVKTEPAKSSGPKVGRASQSSVVEPDRTPMGPTPVNAAKQAKYRENLFDSPLTRAFKAIRERGEATRGYAKGGAVSASKRADGIAQRGKTKGKIY